MLRCLAHAHTCRQYVRAQIHTSSISILVCMRILCAIDLTSRILCALDRARRYVTTKQTLAHTRIETYTGIHKCTHTHTHTLQLIVPRKSFVPGGIHSYTYGKHFGFGGGPNDACMHDVRRHERGCWPHISMVDYFAISVFVGINYSLIMCRNVCVRVCVFEQCWFYGAWVVRRRRLYLMFSTKCN